MFYGGKSIVPVAQLVLRLRPKPRNYSSSSLSLNLQNTLSNSSSPYLKSHSQNPVAWQEWNEKAFELAKELDRPIFLSIGYHTCHWCHVMNKESFSNQEIADILNNNFVPIKLDREERPDVDAVYMMYLQATNGRGGWPLNLFLTPSTLDPIFAGTYWSGPDQMKPNSNPLKFGPGSTQFKDVLNGVINVWNNDRDKVLNSSANISAQLANLVRSKSTSHERQELTRKHVTEVIDHFKNSFDASFGGFGPAPKFPCPSNLSFLLKYGDDDIKNKCLFTLDRIGRGGIKDQIGHGFSRYSVTDDWCLPHFEKMLYDQALLLNAYVDGGVCGSTITEDNNNQSYNDLCYYYANDITKYLINELQCIDPATKAPGAFYSAQDADSLDSNGESKEGAYYVWTAEEFHKVLRPHLGMIDSDACAMFWDVQETGNVNPDLDVQKELAFQNVLSDGGPEYIKKTAEMFGKSEDDIVSLVNKARTILIEHRKATRTPPPLDTKVVTGWNGLAIGALARAGSVLKVPGALDAAISAAKYILRHSYDVDSQVLYRVSGSDIKGMSEDYAYFISGLLDLYDATFDYRYLEWAQDLQDTHIKEFWDEEHGGFYSTDKKNAEDLIFRPKSAFDSAEPSANGVAALNLLRLDSIFQESGLYKGKTRAILNCYSSDIALQPFGYVSLMSAVIQETANDGALDSYIVTGSDQSKIVDFIDDLRQKPKASTTVVLDADSVVYFNSDLYKDIYDKFSKEPLVVHKCSNKTCEVLKI